MAEVGVVQFRRMVGASISARNKSVAKSIHWTASRNGTESIRNCTGAICDRCRIMSCDICAQVDDIVQLSPVDLYFNKCTCIPWVMFYSYDISASRIEDALHKIAVEYPVLCGRLVSNPTTRMHVEVKKGTGFRFTDARSDLTLLEAISQSEVHDKPAEFPSYPELPHSFEDMNLFEVLDHDAPVFRVKLVHYKDGTCSLAVTVHHTIADAQRLANLMVDIARAYRGESLRKMDHDRSRLWPDSFLKSIDLGLSPQDFPRECKLEDEIPPTCSFSDETYSVESIFFPRQDINTLKQKVMAELDAELKYVSQVDVLSAVYWMLKCEQSVLRNGFNGIIQTAEDLQISETPHLFFMELVSNNSNIIPANYFGGGFVWNGVCFPKTEGQHKADLFSTLVQASITIRKQILEDRSSKKHAVKLLEAYKLLNGPGEDTCLTSVLTSYCKMPFKDMDFGQGSPVYSCAKQSCPFHLSESSLAPHDANDGVILNTVILKSEKLRVMNSSVLQELIPGARFLSEMTMDELADILSLKSN